MAFVCPLFLLMDVVGCASPTIKADLVYFPPPPTRPHVVHLKSFNRLSELRPRKPQLVDLVRDEFVGPFVRRPAGIAYHKGHLYICDPRLQAVHDWNLMDGTAKRIAGGRTVRLNKPVAVAVDDQGMVFVADTGRGEVLGFAAGDAPPRRFRPDGRDAYRPAAVAVHDQTLYVADMAGHAVDMFSTIDGEHRGSFGGLGRETGRFHYPSGLACDAQGNLFVSDMFNARVQVFESDGDHAYRLSMGRPGNRYGDMGKPKHLAVGPDGVIFVADSEFAYVHLFNQRGQLLMLMGGSSQEPGGTPMPVGVTVADTLPERLASLVPAGFQADYYLFVANSIGNKRLSLFAVGSPSNP